MNVLVYIVRRLITSIPVALLVAVFSFSLLRFIPGSPVTALLGENASPEAIQEIEEKLGLDKPLHIQFQRWLSGIAHGDLGKGIISDTPVSILILDALEPSFSLAALGIIISLAIGIPAGIIAAVKRNTRIDQVVLTSALLGASIPSFWLGLSLILLFGVKFRLLPTGGYRSILETGNIANLTYLIMPAFAIGFANSALIIRLTRSSMLDTLRGEYIRVARAKGITEIKVIVKHALKCASLPIVTAVGFIFANMISRVVVTESVFGIPGIGRLIVTSILRRDYSVLQGVLLIVAVMYILTNLLVDISYVFLDPRVRH